MPCSGNEKVHCCWVNGKTCPHMITNYTDETGHHRAYACGLRAEFGNWDDVIASDRYKRDVAPHFEKVGINCRDWPTLPGQFCGQCGNGKEECS